VKTSDHDLSPSPVGVGDSQGREDAMGPRDQAVTADAASLPRRRRRPVDYIYSYSVLWALLLEVIVFSLLRPSSFFTLANAQSIIGSQAILLIVALGLTIPMAVNEFDLSIAAVVGFAEVMLAVFAGEHHWPLALAVVATLALCGVVGLVNAIVVVRAGVGAFIATLAMSTILLGVSIAITHDEPLLGIPSSLVSLSSSKFLGVELVFWYGLVITIVLWYLLSRTPVGRWLYFTGASHDVARLNGLPVGRLRAGAFVACSLLAGLAGILYSGVFATADPTTTQDQFLLPAFAAAFLGATAVTPGRFNAWGTFWSVYLVITGITGLSLLTNTVGWISYVFNGGILLIAVSVQRLVARRRARVATE
jgi:ribose transport system permease protein